MRVRIAMRFFTVAVFAACAVAQTASGWVAGTFVTYKVTNSGLPNNSVRAVVIDGSSRLWFGTDNGLARFDGTSWKVFTTADSLPSNKVTALAKEVTRTGVERLWIGTDSGAAVLNVNEGTSATPYRTTTHPGMVSDRITSAVVDSQHVCWFGSENGLMSFNGNSWKSYTTDSTGVKLADNYINAMSYEETNSGPEIWLATNNGISVINTTIDGMSYATPYRTAAHPEMNSNLIISALVDTLRGVRWFGTDMGVIKFQGSTFSSYNFGDYDCLPTTVPDSVTVIAVNPVDSTTTTYFGTNSHGVGRGLYDGITASSPLDEWSYLPSLHIRAITVSNQGILWFGTDRGATMWNPAGADTNNVDITQPIPMALKGNYPNPFNPSTSIGFSLETQSDISLFIYNAEGQRIRELAYGVFPSGAHTVVWDGKDRNGVAVSSGTYFAQLRSGNVAINRKMLLLK